MQLQRYLTIDDKDQRGSRRTRCECKSIVTPCRWHAFRSLGSPNWCHRTSTIWDGIIEHDILWPFEEHRVKTKATVQWPSSDHRNFCLRSRYQVHHRTAKRTLSPFGAKLLFILPKISKNHIAFSKSGCANLAPMQLTRFGKFGW